MDVDGFEVVSRGGGEGRDRGVGTRRSPRRGRARSVADLRSRADRRPRFEVPARDALDGLDAGRNARRPRTRVFYRPFPSVHLSRGVIELSRARVPPTRDSSARATRARRADESHSRLGPVSGVDEARTRAPGPRLDPARWPTQSLTLPCSSRREREASGTAHRGAPPRGRAHVTARARRAAADAPARGWRPSRGSEDVERGTSRRPQTAMWENGEKRSRS